MASQVNSQFAYINLINGETIWERLRIVRNFIEDRTIAKRLQTIQELKHKAHLAKVQEATKESERLFAQAELEEFEAHQDQQQDGYKKLDDEIAFLIKYEAELAIVAEQSRIDGKTDDEMYQLNMDTEVYIRNLKKIETEQVARTLCISQATAEEAMRIPKMRIQLLNTATAMLLPDNDENKGSIIANGINLNSIPLSVQETLSIANLLIQANQNETV
jgi:hypothetical protein